MESKGGRHSSIVLCTNGILLRVLISEGLGKLTTEASEKSRKNVVSDLTHIIVVCFLCLASGFYHFLLALRVVLLLWVGRVYRRKIWCIHSLMYFWSLERGFFPTNFHYKIIIILIRNKRFHEGKEVQPRGGPGKRELCANRNN